MPDTFACPECGSEVAPRGFSPGRQVRCPDCRTLVEVPYIPRAVQRRRQYHQKASWSLPRVAAIGGGAVLLTLVVALVVAGLWKKAQREQRKRQETEIATHLESAQRTARPADATPGALEAAIIGYDQAIALAHSHHIVLPPNVPRERDALVVRRAAARLDSVASQPTIWLATLHDLKRSVLEEPALRALDERIDREIAAAARRVTQEHLERARQCAPGEALAAARVAFDAAADLPTAEARTVREAAETIAREVAGRVGVVVEPIAGYFRIGSERAYLDLLGRLETALARRGYVAAPASQGWEAVWGKAARYRLAVKIQERALPYAQSALSASRIDVDLDLSRGAEVAWRAHASGQTRVPPTRMSAYEAGRLATATKHSPEAERRLYQDAKDHLLERLEGMLNGMPAPAAAPAGP